MWTALGQRQCSKYSTERKQKESTLGEAIAGAAVAIVKALKQSPEKQSETPAAPTTMTGVSPGKKVLLSGQYLKQLETIQKLKDEGVLTLTGFN